ncbi:trichohyalin [Parambassis ranga]|uniref:Trichohyalin n=1 Tax=Parambassis ranga TaxID=210632 RepID=A0A6P7KIX6_9TELE|nr:trichohyalin-like [Parambassis ranga]
MGRLLGPDPDRGPPFAKKGKKEQKRTSRYEKLASEFCSLQSQLDTVLETNSLLTSLVNEKNSLEDRLTQEREAKDQCLLQQQEQSKELQLLRTTNSQIHTELTEQRSLVQQLSAENEALRQLTASKARLRQHEELLPDESYAKLLIKYVRLKKRLRKQGVACNIEEEEEELVEKRRLVQQVGDENKALRKQLRQLPGQIRLDLEKELSGKEAQIISLQQSLELQQKHTETQIQEFQAKLDKAITAAKEKSVLEEELKRRRQKEMREQEEAAEQNLINSLMAENIQVKESEARLRQQEEAALLPDESYVLLLIKCMRLKKQLRKQEAANAIEKQNPSQRRPVAEKAKKGKKEQKRTSRYEKLASEFCSLQSQLDTVLETNSLLTSLVNEKNSLEDRLTQEREAKDQCLLQQQEQSKELQLLRTTNSQIHTELTEQRSLVQQLSAENEALRQLTASKARLRQHEELLPDESYAKLLIKYVRLKKRLRKQGVACNIEEEEEELVEKRRLVQQVGDENKALRKQLRQLPGQIRLDLEKELSGKEAQIISLQQSLELQQKHTETQIQEFQAKLDKAITAAKEKSVLEEELKRRRQKEMREQEEAAEQNLINSLMAENIQVKESEARLRQQEEAALLPDESYVLLLIKCMRLKKQLRKQEAANTIEKQNPSQRRPVAEKAKKGKKEQKRTSRYEKLASEFCSLQSQLDTVLETNSLLTSLVNEKNSLEDRLTQEREAKDQCLLQQQEQSKELQLLRTTNSQIHTELTEQRSLVQQLSAENEALRQLTASKARLRQHEELLPDESYAKLLIKYVRLKKRLRKQGVACNIEEEEEELVEKRRLVQQVGDENKALRKQLRQLPGQIRLDLEKELSGKEAQIISLQQSLELQQKHTETQIQEFQAKLDKAITAAKEKSVLEEELKRRRQKEMREQEEAAEQNLINSLMAENIQVKESEARLRQQEEAALLPDESYVLLLIKCMRLKKQLRKQEAANTIEKQNPSQRRPVAEKAKKGKKEQKRTSRYEKLASEFCSLQSQLDTVLETNSLLTSLVNEKNSLEDRLTQEREAKDQCLLQQQEQSKELQLLRTTNSQIHTELTEQRSLVQQLSAENEALRQLTASKARLRQHEELLPDESYAKLLIKYVRLKKRLRKQGVACNIEEEEEELVEKRRLVQQVGDENKALRKQLRQLPGQIRLDLEKELSGKEAQIISLQQSLELQQKHTETQIQEFQAKLDKAITAAKEKSVLEEELKRRRQKEMREQEEAAECMRLKKQLRKQEAANTIEKQNPSQRRPVAEKAKKGKKEQKRTSRYEKLASEFCSLQSQLDTVLETNSLLTSLVNEKNSLEDRLTQEREAKDQCLLQQQEQSKELQLLRTTNSQIHTELTEQRSLVQQLSAENEALRQLTASKARLRQHEELLPDESYAKLLIKYVRLKKRLRKQGVACNIEEEEEELVEKRRLVQQVGDENKALRKQLRQLPGQIRLDLEKELSGKEAQIISLQQSLELQQKHTETQIQEFQAKLDKAITAAKEKSVLEEELKRRRQKEMREQEEAAEQNLINSLMAENIQVKESEARLRQQEEAALLPDESYVLLLIKCMRLKKQLRKQEAANTIEKQNPSQRRPVAEKAKKGKKEQKRTSRYEKLASEFCSLQSQLDTVLETNSLLTSLVNEKNSLEDRLTQEREAKDQCLLQQQEQSKELQLLRTTNSQIHTELTEQRSLVQQLSAENEALRQLTASKARLRQHEELLPDESYAKLLIKYVRLKKRLRKQGVACNIEEEEEELVEKRRLVQQVGDENKALRKQLRQLPGQIRLDLEKELSGKEAQIISLQQSLELQQKHTETQIQEFQAKLDKAITAAKEKSVLEEELKRRRQKEMREQEEAAEQNLINSLMAENIQVKESEARLRQQEEAALLPDESYVLLLIKCMRLKKQLRKQEAANSYRKAEPFTEETAKKGKKEQKRTSRYEKLASEFCSLQSQLDTVLETNSLLTSLVNEKNSLEDRLTQEREAKDQCLLQQQEQSKELQLLRTTNSQIHTELTEQRSLVQQLSAENEALRQLTASKARLRQHEELLPDESYAKLLIKYVRLKKRLRKQGVACNIEEEEEELVEKRRLVQQVGDENKALRKQLRQLPGQIRLDLEKELSGKEAQIISLQQSLELQQKHTETQIQEFQAKLDKAITAAKEKSVLEEELKRRRQKEMREQEEAAEQNLINSLMAENIQVKESEARLRQQEEAALLPDESYVLLLIKCMRLKKQLRKQEAANTIEKQNPSQRRPVAEKAKKGKKEQKRTSRYEKLASEFCSLQSQLDTVLETNSLLTSLVNEKNSLEDRLTQEREAKDQCLLQQQEQSKELQLLRTTNSQIHTELTEQRSLVQQLSAENEALRQLTASKARLRQHEELLPDESYAKLLIKYVRLKKRLRKQGVACNIEEEEEELVEKRRLVQQVGDENKALRKQLRQLPGQIRLDLEKELSGKEAQIISLQQSLELQQKHTETQIQEFQAKLDKAITAAKEKSVLEEELKRRRQKEMREQEEAAEQNLINSLMAENIQVKESEARLRQQEEAALLPDESYVLLLIKCMRLKKQLRKQEAANTIEKQNPSQRRPVAEKAKKGKKEQKRTSRYEKLASEFCSLQSQLDTVLETNSLLTSLVNEKNSLEDRLTQEREAKDQCLLQQQEQSKELQLLRTTNSQIHTELTEQRSLVQQLSAENEALRQLTASKARLRQHEELLPDESYAKLLIKYVRLKKRLRKQGVACNIEEEEEELVEKRRLVQQVGDENKALRKQLRQLPGQIRLDLEKELSGKEAQIISLQQSLELQQKHTETQIQEFQAKLDKAITAAKEKSVLEEELKRRRQKEMREQEEAAEQNLINSLMAENIQVKESEARLRQQEEAALLPDESYVLLLIKCMRLKKQLRKQEAANAIEKQNPSQRRPVAEKGKETAETRGGRGGRQKRAET